MDELIEALKKLDIDSPKFGSIEIVFRDGVPLDVIIENRIRIIKN